MELPYKSIFKVNQHLLMLSEPLRHAYAIVCSANLSISINGACIFSAFICCTMFLGRPTGQAFVRFKDAEQGEKALERNKCVPPGSVHVFPFMRDFVDVFRPSTCMAMKQLLNTRLCPKRQKPYASDSLLKLS